MIVTVLALEHTNLSLCTKGWCDWGALYKLVQFSALMCGVLFQSVLISSFLDFHPEFEELDFSFEGE